MAKIKSIKAFEILDSRGMPTIEVSAVLQDGTIGIAACPSGASIGTWEAVELRDQDPTRFNGQGVLKAIKNIEEIIAPKLVGIESTKQADVDRIMIELDGTQNKSHLGANSMLAVSMAVAKAAARSSVLPLYMYLRQYIKKENTVLKIPTPAFNLINGGKHALNSLDFQEFMIIPASGKTFTQALLMGFNIYQSLKDILKSNNLSTLVGDEGGFGASLPSNADGFLLLKQAIDACNIRLGFDIFLGLDAASTSFYTNHLYHLKDRPSGMSTHDLTTYYEDINKKYHLLYLEDPMAEDDWPGWVAVSEKLAHETIIVGDDLTVTNPYRLQMALDKKTLTGIIIKPNQIGTVIESLAVVEVARQAGLKIIVSHRSGETNDDFIADFAVAVSADYVKFGAPARGERVAKYNRLLHINEQLHALNAKQ